MQTHTFQANHAIFTNRENTEQKPMGGQVSHGNVVVDPGEVVGAVEGSREGHPDHGPFRDEEFPYLGVSGCNTIGPISSHREQPHCFLCVKEAQIK